MKRDWSEVTDPGIGLSPYRCNEHGERLRDHEERIRKVESQTRPDHEERIKKVEVSNVKTTLVIGALSIVVSAFVGGFGALLGSKMAAAALAAAAPAHSASAAPSTTAPTASVP